MLLSIKIAHPLMFIKIKVYYIITLQSCDIFWNINPDLLIKQLPTPFVRVCVCIYIYIYICVYNPRKKFRVFVVIQGELESLLNAQWWQLLDI